MLEIEFDGFKGFDHQIEDALLRVAEEAVVSEGLCRPWDACLSFTDDEGIRILNNKYRGINYPTDVLSFPQQDWNDGGDCGGDYILLGDVVISLETAQRQANEYGHSLKRELCFLLAHGMLHLLGYNHDNADGEEEMNGKQRDVLERLGITREQGFSPEGS